LRAGDIDDDSVMPAIVALRVDKQTSGGRGSKSGRMYLAAVSEALTDPGVAMSWSGVAQSQINGFLDSFLTGINNEAGANGREQALVVTHTVNGVFSSSSNVTALTVNSAVSSQVRRGLLR
jgi:hypothetical protein